MPQRVVNYSAQDLSDWESIWRCWLRTPKADFSIWREYQDIVNSGRFNFHSRENPGERFYFGEAFVARQLEQEGFLCWGTCRLFRVGNQKSPYCEQTEEVAARIRAAGRSLPAECVSRLSFEPRNPDIAAWHRTKGFRFVEVKTNTSRNRLEQQQSLAVLRELLDADVSVVRLVRDTSTATHKAELPAGFTVR